MSKSEPKYFCLARGPELYLFSIHFPLIPTPALLSIDSFWDPAHIRPLNPNSCENRQSKLKAEARGACGCGVSVHILECTGL